MSGNPTNREVTQNCDRFGSVGLHMNRRSALASVLSSICVLLAKQPQDATTERSCQGCGVDEVLIPGSNGRAQFQGDKPTISAMRITSWTPVLSLCTIHPLAQ